MTGTVTTTSTARPAVDKRAAILSAALRLIARFGLHNTPMSAVAREAGVAAGTLYLYFPSKEAMINALYLDVLRERHETMTTHLARGEEGLDPRAALWQAWNGLAQWHFDHVDESNLIDQCRASGILTAETRAIEQQISAEGVRDYGNAVADGILWNMPPQIFWSMFAGPILLLAHMRDGKEIEITDEVLRTTFDAVCRAVLRPGSLTTP
jgi:AcrR family transcriptional regulator